jgi:hypothetical protein
MPYECFADEIAIDFPAVGRVVDRMRDAFLGERGDADVLRAEVSLSQREAFDGRVVSLRVPVRVTCPNCGGRGETWTEACHLCHGLGESVVPQSVRVPVPPGIADGSCVRFRVTTRDQSSVRVEMRVAIRSNTT